MEDYIGLEELNKEKQEEFEKLAEDYSNVIQLMNLFIEVNNLDRNQVWDKADLIHDKNVSYAPDNE